MNRPYELASKRLTVYERVARSWRTPQRMDISACLHMGACSIREIDPHPRPLSQSAGRGEAAAVEDGCRTG